MPTSIANGYSYEYQNTIRSVVELFDRLVASAPTFLSLIPRGPNAMATKEEWLEDSLSPVSSTIASFDTDGDGTGINLASTAGIRAGAILRVTTSADVSRTEQVKVASVDSATDLTVVRDYGSTVGETFVVGDKVYLVSSPLNEKTEAGSGNGQEPDMAYNYVQIFERIADISRTAQVVKKYGMASGIDYQVGVKLQELAYELNNAAIYGRRVVRSSTENGTMGGILQYMESGNIETTGGAISETIINNMLEAIFDDGAFSNAYALLCAENQARKISAFNTSGTNPIVQIQQTPQQFTGHYTSDFVGDIPVFKDRGGFRATIVVDPNFPKDQVAIVDLTRVDWAWLEDSPLVDRDATPPGFDGIKRRILGEATLRVKNGQQAHALATGLTV